MIKGKRILITGAAGSIGQELTRQLAVDNELYLIDNNETELFNLLEELNQKNAVVKGRVGDVRHWSVFRASESLFGKPSLIFHCAALKHVTPSAWSPEEYTTINVLGTINAVNFASLTRSHLINISTDKVVNPNSVMAATKKLSEIIVRDAGQVSVRFGNVMGSRGSVLEIWQRQIDSGEPLTITDKQMLRYMMTIPEAVNLVIQAADIGKAGDIVVLDMGEKVNILDLATRILKKSGSKPPFGDDAIKIIGSRPGETMIEELMTAEEKKRAKRVNTFYVIEPA